MLLYLYIQTLPLSEMPAFCIVVDVSIDHRFKFLHEVSDSSHHLPSGTPFTDLVVDQIDLAPTLALLLGLPIPQNR